MVTENLKQINSKRLLTENKAWKKDIEITQAWDRCEKLVQDYTEICTTLQLIPVENENDFDFSISIGTLLEPKISCDVNLLKEHLRQLMKEYRTIDKQTFDIGLAIENALNQTVEKKKSSLQRKVSSLEVQQEKISNLRVEEKEKTRK